MMRFISYLRCPSMLKSVLTYLWQGSTALCSIFLLLALWQLGHDQYGSFILPSPAESALRLYQLLLHSGGAADMLISARRAATGFTLALCVAGVLGILAGRINTLALLLRPMITLILGTPPVAWLVLALLWFGSGDGSPVFTVLISCVPVIFANTAQGIRSLDGQLTEVATLFRLPLYKRVWHLYLPHLCSYLLPAALTAIGIAWKVVVMAELLGSDSGVGARLALARSSLDTAATLGWVLAMVGTLLLIEALLFEPLKQKVEAWRLP